MSGARPLGLLGAGLIALTAGGLALHRPGEITLPSLQVTWVFVALMAVAAALYFAAVAVVLRRPARGCFWIVVLVAVAMRAIVLPAPPFLSSDVFRYVWDGKVQDAGINPYRYLPVDPALEQLRDGWIFPHINRAGTARTIYAPMAELVFGAVAAISPSVVAMKAAMCLFELLGVAGIVYVLRAIRQPAERILIYAWNPLAVWAFAGNGHADAIGIGFLGLAIAASVARRQALAGVLLSCAALVKFLPAVVAPALWRRWDWRMPAAAVITALALYGIYIAAGWSLLGYLPGYSAEEDLGSGSGFWLLAGLERIAPLPPFAGRLYIVIAAAALFGLALVVAGRDRRADPIGIARRTALLATATVFAISPHYAWYYPWLALPCCICPIPGVIYLSAAALLLYVNPLDEHFLWPCLLFLPALSLLGREWVGQRAIVRNTACPSA